MKCPNCGREMAGGYLTVPLHYGLHSMKWSEDPRHHILGDDIIYDPKQEVNLLSAGSAISAERCTQCRIAVFHY